MNPHDYDFKMTIKVRDYEVDYQGIVNNSVYLNYMELTRHEFCEQAGLTFARMHARGIDPVLRRSEIDYITPLRSGDVMLSCLRMERQGARFIFVQDIYRNDTLEPVARGRITVATLENGRLTRGDSLAEAFKDYLHER